MANVFTARRQSRVETLDMVKPAGNWVPSISEDRRNYTPQAGFKEKLQAKVEEIKRNPRAISTPSRPVDTEKAEILKNTPRGMGGHLTRIIGK
jgi:hypothetical protein